MRHFNWSPGIGDPTLMGWLTVVLYLAAAFLCLRVMRKLSGEGRSGTREIKIWQFLSYFFLALGINKQLDLQSALTEAFRVLAINQGWYDSRQTVQLEFIILVAGFCLAAAITMTYWARRTRPETRIAVVGTIVLLAYIFMRAASFHHLDAYVSHRALGLKWSWILEIGGIATVIVASLSALLRDRLPRLTAALHKRAAVNAGRYPD